ncbi:MAG TPA: Bax inhibitor-1/YccA family protein [Gammaproteobacteria bacterium]|mgnify:CR=1 FL=1|nr:Bax inhibitor-1/YccA family protein [Gammaproteobacteria bacterium]
MPTNIAVNRSEGVVIQTNKLIRNTYSLLAMTLLFSALMAALSMAVDLGRGTYLISTIAAFGLILFVLPRTANSAAGIGVVFAITGLLGFGLGPLLSMYLSLPNGPQVVMTALGGTGVIFLGLSAYALTTRRDFSFMGGFLFVGMLVVLGAMLLNIFLAMPLMTVVLSAAVVMLMSGFILYDTGRLVNGGETNYVLATVSLYLSMFNIFVSLLQLLGIAGSDD